MFESSRAHHLHFRQTHTDTPRAGFGTLTTCSAEFLFIYRPFCPLKRPFCPLDLEPSVIDPLALDVYVRRYARQSAYHCEPRKPDRLNL